MNYRDILTGLLSLIVLLVLLDVIEATYYQARALHVERPGMARAIVEVFMLLLIVGSPFIAISILYLAVPHGP